MFPMIRSEAEEPMAKYVRKGLNVYRREALTYILDKKKKGALSLPLPVPHK